MNETLSCGIEILHFGVRAYFWEVQLQIVRYQPGDRTNPHIKLQIPIPIPRWLHGANWNEPHINQTEVLPEKPQRTQTKVPPEYWGAGVLRCCRRCYLGNAAVTEPKLLELLELRETRSAKRFCSLLTRPAIRLLTARGRTVELLKQHRRERRRGEGAKTYYYRQQTQSCGRGAARGPLWDKNLPKVRFLTSHCT